MNKFENGDIVIYDGKADDFAGLEIEKGYWGYVDGNRIIYNCQHRAKTGTIPLQGICDIRKNFYKAPTNHPLVGKKFIVDEEVVRGNFYAPNHTNTIEAYIPKRKLLVISWGDNISVEKGYTDFDVNTCEERLADGKWKLIEEE